MDRIIRLIFTLGLLFLVNPLIAEALSPIERINERYDDFWRYIKAREQRAEKSQISNDDRKKGEAARKENLERERQKYVLERKARPSLEHLRPEYEAQLKEEKEKNELLRRRYVEQRDETEQYLKKGRRIPEMKEYDLEGY